MNARWTTVYRPNILSAVFQITFIDLKKAVPFYIKLFSQPGFGLCAFQRP